MTKKFRTPGNFGGKIQINAVNHRVRVLIVTSKVKSEAFFGSSAPFPLQFKALWLLQLVHSVVSSSKLLACFGFRPGSCVWRWLPPQSAAICRRGAAVLHSTERQKRSFVQLQVDENSARAAALHYDLELQNSIEL